MSNILDMTIAETRKALDEKKVSAKEVISAYIKAAEDTRDLNAYITETFDQALAKADLADQYIQKGMARPLEGIPIGMKDLFCTEGVRTTAASKILHNFVPPYESTVSKNILDAGGIVIGKTNLDEFAMGSSNMTSHFGGVTNPWQRTENGKVDPTKLVPGGSSGGSAAAVSARSCLMATGTDTGGSIRQPAAFCGITGIKPTYGRCSRWGIVAFASSLDQAGPMTRDVRDAALCLNVMSSYDPKDSTSANIEKPDFTKSLGQKIKGLKIGIPKEYRVAGMNPEIELLWQQGMQWLEDQGAETVEVSLPHTKYALATYYILAPAEASSNLARYDGVRFGLRVEGDTLDEMYMNTRAAGFGEEVRNRILVGTYVLSAGYYDAYYLKAQKLRSLIAHDFRRAFDKVDVLLTPAAPTPAFAAGENMDDPITMYLNDAFTVPASLAGLPAMVVPAGLSSNNLPLGLQLIGRAFDEETIFKTAFALEQAANFTAKPQLVAA